MKTSAGVGWPFSAMAGMTLRQFTTRGLSGATDDQVFDACLSENRTLITLDRDFGHLPRFSPKRTAGIVVVELGGPASQQALHSRLRQFLKVATSRPVHGELWIVEPGRIRVHPEKDTE